MTEARVGPARASEGSFTSLPIVASLLGFSAGLIWSFGSVAVLKADQADAWQYLIWRSIGIIVFIEILAMIRRQPRVLPRAFTSGRVMWLGCLGLFAASLLYVYGLKNTSAANVAFLSSVTPLVAAVIGRFVLRERMNRMTIITLIVAMIGLLIMVVSDIGVGTMRGNIAALLSSVGLAVYTICLRTSSTVDWTPVLPGYALLMILVCGAVTLSNGNTLVPPAKDLAWAMLVHGGVLIIAGTLAFNVASRTVPAVGMTILAQTESVFGPFWVFLVFAQRPKPATLIGGGIILAAVLAKAVFDGRAAQPAA